MKSISRIRIIEAPEEIQLGKDSMSLLFGGDSVSIICATFTQCTSSRNDICQTHSPDLCGGSSDSSDVLCATYTVEKPTPSVPDIPPSDPFSHGF